MEHFELYPKCDVYKNSIGQLWSLKRCLLRSKAIALGQQQRWREVCRAKELDFGALNLPLRRGSSSGGMHIARTDQSHINELKASHRKLWLRVKRVCIPCMPCTLIYLKILISCSFRSIYRFFKLITNNFSLRLDLRSPVLDDCNLEICWASEQKRFQPLLSASTQWMALRRCQDRLDSSQTVSKTV